MDYGFVLTGSTPLLKHADNLDLAEEVKKWRDDPQNASLSVKGDDRSPAWTWLAYLHHDGEHLAMPQDAIMASLRHVGAKIKSGKSTLKSLSQSALLIGSEYCKLTVDGNQIPVAKCYALRDRPFSEQVAGVRKLGFDLMAKRAKVGMSRNVRVRPMFRTWQVEGTITASDPIFDEKMMTMIFEMAGRLAGLLDWRPSSKQSPGPYGMFTSALKPIKATRRAG